MVPNAMLETITFVRGSRYLAPPVTQSASICDRVSICDSVSSSHELPRDGPGLAGAILEDGARAGFTLPIGR